MNRITLEDLSRRMADPDTDPQELARYFDEDDARSEPFAPVVTLDPDTVDIPGTSRGARSALVLNGANWLDRQHRQSKFFRRLAEGDYDGPVIVEEGDSWFQYPILLHDTIDVLMETYAVFSLSAGGDTLANMVRRAEYRRAIEQTGATFLLLSGGGNDLVANGNLAAHLRRFDAALSPRDYVLPSFDRLMATALAHFDTVFRDVARRFPQVRVLCHGYDLVVPAAGKWLGKPMETNGIGDPELQSAIASDMMDRFNAGLERQARRHDHVSYLDLRGTVGTGRWHDELHPTNDGYRDVAAVFARAIESGGARERGPRPRSSGPSAISLHVGVNKVDQGHYRNTLSDLNFCVFDAEAMEAVARERGITERTLLSDEAATRDAVLGRMAEAATTLKAGDLFLFSYAGHGGQITDFNGDEATGPDRDDLDETLCLHDAQLIDDELYDMWSRFAEGVRIVAVFDSCHSGSAIRAAIDGPEPPLPGTARMMSLRAAFQVVQANRDFYRSLPSSSRAADMGPRYREAETPIAASVLQLSACQSNQKAFEVLGNGRFTAAILETLSEPGHQNGYSAFIDRCAAKLGAYQTPKFWSLGPSDPVFEGQRVFSI